MKNGLGKQIAVGVISAIIAGMVLNFLGNVVNKKTQ